MTIDPGERERVVRYMLGELSDEAASGLEERYFGNPAYRELVEVVEDELVDAYVRKELSASEARRFETNFLRSPEHQQKLALARALLYSGSRRRRLQVTLRWAAVIMIGAVGLTTMWTLKRSGSVTPALVLTPGDRGSEQPKRLVITEGTAAVSVRAELEGVRSDQVLEAVLRAIDETEVLRVRVTMVRFSKSGGSVDVLLPGSLPGGDYILQIEAVDSGPDSRVVGSYYLGVARHRPRR